MSDTAPPQEGAKVKTPAPKAKEPETTGQPGAFAKVTPVNGADINQAVTEAYERGKADGIVEARAAQRPSLFEQAKRLAARNWSEDDKTLRAAIETLQDEYDDTLSAADVELVLTIARKKRSAAGAEREAIASLTRPRGGRNIDHSGDTVVA